MKVRMIGAAGTFAGAVMPEPTSLALVVRDRYPGCSILAPVSARIWYSKVRHLGSLIGWLTLPTTGPDLSIGTWVTCWPSFPR
jgi:hypothetical protein